VGCAINISTPKIDIQVTSRKGIRTILRLKLKSGYYLLGAANPIKVGNCVMLHVTRKHIKVIDDEQVLHVEACDGIRRVYYVRRYQQVKVENYF
jgi:hypothetical protein